MPSSADEYLRANLAAWNDTPRQHLDAELYDVPGFRSGRTSLKSIELAELGDVTGKSLLHLQCHFGLDTMSWARRGAIVTGVDFSDQAIALAQSLSAELRIPSRFVCAPIYDLPGALTGQFDLVFTSYGALPWLPDLARWAAVIAHFVKPGGRFHLIEDHPFAAVFGNEPGATALKFSDSYFRAEVIEDPPGNDYAGAKCTHFAYQWLHSLGSIVDSLVGAGLTIEFIHEFPICAWRKFPFAEKGADGWWRIPGDPIPLTFSLAATKAR
jgi:SAM-dependent methyltransferase